ncbi:hypothetical protein HDU96_008883 [Phlyctochytrium bullatum]|nr:hypothetical protein HDU96_008883 [Phlyctochytrium bullatum]
MGMEAASPSSATPSLPRAPDLRLLPPEVEALAVLEHDPRLGRYLTARNELDAVGSKVVDSARPFAIALLDSFKKRYCAQCLAESLQARTFSHRCLSCDQVYFCSAPCELAANREGHAVVCGALRKLATFKASQHEKSIIKLILFALLERRRQEDRSGQIVLSNLGPGWGGWDVVKDAASKLPSGPDGPGKSENEDRTSANLPSPSIDGPTNVDSTNHGEDDEAAKAAAAEAAMFRELFSTLDFEGYAIPPTSPPLWRSAWSSVIALQSHYDEWTPDTKAEWKKTRTFAARMVRESGLEKELLMLPIAALHGENGDVSEKLSDLSLHDAGNGANERAGVQRDGADFTVGSVTDAQVEEGIMHMVSRIESNGFGVYAVPRKDSKDEKAVGQEKPKGPGGGGGLRSCVGRAIYPVASYFNHSCDPSCECVQVQGLLTVKTTRALKQGLFQSKL